MPEALFIPAPDAEKMAERVGFEPTIPVKVCPLSRRIVSTAHAPLRKEAFSCQPSAKTTNDRRRFLTPAFKERLQQFRATARQNSAANFYSVIELRMIQNLHHRLH